MDYNVQFVLQCIQHVHDKLMSVGLVVDAVKCVLVGGDDTTRKQVCKELAEHEHVSVLLSHALLYWKSRVRIRLCTKIWTIFDKKQMRRTLLKYIHNAICRCGLTCILRINMPDMDWKWVCKIINISCICNFQSFQYGVIW